MRTCIYRVTGSCLDCTWDYNVEHHPNNGDCPRHTEVNVYYFTVREEVVKRKPSRKLSEFEERVAKWEDMKRLSDAE